MSKEVIQFVEMVRKSYKPTHTQPEYWRWCNHCQAERQFMMTPGSRREIFTCSFCGHKIDYRIGEL